MSQRHSDSMLDEKSKQLAYRLHSELCLDEDGNPVPGLPRHRSSLKSMDNAAFQAERTRNEPHQVILSTESPAALKVGTQQLIPKNLAVSTKSKTPTRHQSFAQLSKETGRRDAKRLSAPRFSLDDLEVDVTSVGSLRRNIRNPSYRAAMKGFGTPAEPKPAPSLKPLTEESAQGPARSPVRNKKTLGRKRPNKGSFKDDPGFYQDLQERGLNTSHEWDDDQREDCSSPESPCKADTTIVVKSYRPAQVTWSQLPEVVESGILNQLSPEERKRQEAIFEIITSEFSYLHSLGILVSEFLKSKELKATMTQTEHHHLFSNIVDVQGASQKFFEELERRHKENFCISDISDILEDHALNHFHPYVAYCTNEVYQQRTLQKLTNSNPPFQEVLRQIEKKPACGGLPMFSFLILPMQRVTRLPLLMDTLCQKTQGQPDRFKVASRALKAISKLVKQCNEGAHKMERMEQMCTLQTHLDFSKIKAFPLISASRWLLKRGEVSLVEEPSLFRKISSRPTCYLFLFNDALMVTKKKSDEHYVVMSHAKKDQIQVKKMEPDEISFPGGTNRSSSIPYPFQVTMLKNSEGKQEQFLLSTDSLSDRARWITALERKENQAQGLANKEKLQQVEITKAYLAKQADELTLQQADVVLIQQQEDGWFYGERLRDGEVGWFPEDYARVITSREAVERNVRRLERLRVETDV
ncbi:rho guanine nucleotide exchange factor 16 [Macrotis lagotis]|uniref:rho guanine nucleotide exchange factor 16 n=1 Tax=Macrotis lagotis TaxID=92651 RepID=UPI003D6956FA